MRPLAIPPSSARAFACVVCIAASALAHARPGFAEEPEDIAASEPGAEGLETRIPERRVLRPASGDRTGRFDAELATATPEDALENLSGLSLAREGGPLAPARLHIRGLAGPRARLVLGGLVLGDPATGEIDVALVPLYAATALSEQLESSHALGGSLSVEPLESYFPSLRARFGAGTLGTLRANVVAGAPTPDGGHLTLGVELATTRGDFAFVPITRSGTPLTGSVLRANNDQHRANALFSARIYQGPATLEVLAWGAAHEGGIPGFATAPTSALRGQRLEGGARGQLRIELDDIELSLAAHGLSSSRHVQSPVAGIDDALASVTSGLEAELRHFQLLPQLRVAVAARAATSAVLDRPFARTSAGVALRSDGRLGAGGSLLDRLIFEGKLALDGTSDVGLLPSGHLAVEFMPVHAWALGARVSHSARPPSLDELYAPRGWVLGNPDLAPERSSDVELYARLDAKRIVDARLAAFAGRMEEAILFLPRSAFEVRPTNTGPVLRAGLEGRVRVTPHAMAALDLTTDLLWSRMELTGAPLPTAPPFQARLRGRLGKEDAHHVVVVMRHRGETSSNFFGTLPLPAYTLFDAILRWPLGTGLAATLALSNLFDVQTAQDTNLLPLPGRQVFCTLEVRHD